MDRIREAWKIVERVQCDARQLKQYQSPSVEFHVGGTKFDEKSNGKKKYINEKEIRDYSRSWNKKNTRRLVDRVQMPCERVRPLAHTRTRTFISGTTGVVTRSAERLDEGGGEGKERDRNSSSVT